jgi:hypothetical protein
MNNDNFYVMIRASQNADTLGRKMIPCFEKIGVHYIDYSDQEWPERYIIKGDGHPSPAGHEVTAEWLARDLNLNQATTSNNDWRTQSD